jgi:molecular chaperone GrpE
MAQNTSSKARAADQGLEQPAEQPADVDALAAENASLRDRMLRALADAENTRRRSERTTQEASRYAVTDFAREVLTVADNLRRTLEAAERAPRASAEDAALIEGVRATQRMLMQALEGFGVRKIEALGAPFDPTLHEAVFEVEDPSHPPGTVVQVVEDGYTIHDRLLRAARVGVSKRPAEAAPQASDAAGDSQSSSSDHLD